MVMASWRVMNNVTSENSTLIMDKLDVPLNVLFKLAGNASKILRVKANVSKALAPKLSRECSNRLEDATISRLSKALLLNVAVMEWLMMVRSVITVST